MNKIKNPSWNDTRYATRIVTYRAVWSDTYNDVARNVTWLIGRNVTDNVTHNAIYQVMKDE